MYLFNVQNQCINLMQVYIESTFLFLIFFLLFCSPASAHVTFSHRVGHLNDA